MLRQSILLQKARELGLPNISGAPHGSLLVLYKNTLAEMERYLDTGDLRKLTFTSLGYIKQDVLDIIGGLREIPFSAQKANVRTMDGILTNLRLARNNIQTAHGMFIGEYLDERKSNKFFHLLDEARANIADALKYFR